MKNKLLLLILILMSCRKNSNIQPGDEIIGSYQLEGFVDCLSDSKRKYLDESSSIRFNSNKKGFYTYLYNSLNELDDSESRSLTQNFDWSFNGKVWELKSQNEMFWEVSFSQKYTMKLSDSDCFYWTFEKSVERGINIGY
tara:strand:+ start:94 stop:513 length:420 start_codon:yes stop_codon:yes gene_type:complete